MAGVLVDMLVPKLNYSFTNSYLKQKQTFVNNENNTGSLSNIHQDEFVKSADVTKPLNFGRYSPSSKDLGLFTQAADLIKSKAVKTLGVLCHMNPVGDDVSSALALTRMIEKATGKKPKVFIQKPLPAQLQFLDPNNEIIVLTKPNGLHMNAHEIAEIYGNQDLIMVVDSSTKKLLDKPIREGIYETAKHTVKFDHHIVDPKSIEEFNYADINIVVPKESASLVVMQLTRPLGLKPKDIDYSISNPLLTGLIADTGNFKHSNDPHSIKDAKLLKTANRQEIIDNLYSLTPNEKLIYDNLLKEIKFNDNGQIAYFVVDKRENHVGKNITTKILEDLRDDNQGVKYCFSVAEENNGSIVVSLRSKDKSIKDVVKKLSGKDNVGGHDCAASITFIRTPPEEAISSIIRELNSLENNTLAGIFEHRNALTPVGQNLGVAI